MNRSGLIQLGVYTYKTNKTDQSLLNYIYPDLNYVGTAIRSFNKKYFIDQAFREREKIQHHIINVSF